MFHHPITLSSASGQTDRTCTLGYICTALGRISYGERRRCAYVRQLIAHHGFPRPLPTLHRRQLTSDVVASSRWLRAAVDNWLEDFLPPDAAAALDSEAQRVAAAAMDNAAANLGALRLVSSRS